MVVTQCCGCLAWWVVALGPVLPNTDGSCGEKELGKLSQRGGTIGSHMDVLRRTRAILTRRMPRCHGNWVHVTKGGNLQKATSVFGSLFFARTSPAFALGALFGKVTDGAMGAFVMPLSLALGDNGYGLFTGQPLGHV